MEDIKATAEPWGRSRKPYFYSLRGKASIISMRIPTEHLSPHGEFSIVHRTLLELSGRDDADSLFKSVSEGTSALGDDANGVLVDAVRAAYKSFEEDEGNPDEGEDESRNVFPSATFPKDFRLPGILNGICIEIDATGKFHKFRPFVSASGAYMNNLQGRRGSQVTHELRTDHDKCSWKFDPVIQSQTDKATGLTKLTFTLHGKNCAGRHRFFTMKECEGLYEEVSNLMNGDDDEVKEDLARIQGYTHGQIPRSLAARLAGLASSWADQSGIKCYSRGTVKDAKTRPIVSKHLRQSAMTVEEVQEGAKQRGEDVINGREVTLYHWSGCEDSMDDKINRTREVLADTLIHRYGDPILSIAPDQPSLSQISDCLVGSVEKVVNQLNWPEESSRPIAKVHLDIVSQSEVPEIYRCHMPDSDSGDYVRIWADWIQAGLEPSKQRPDFVPIHGSKGPSSARTDANTVHFEFDTTDDHCEITAPADDEGSVWEASESI